jgi:hypothetical protein
MSSFDDRRDAFEKKFVHDEELQFRIESHAAHQFGLWAAHQLGLSGDEAEQYARGVIGANLQHQGHDARRKVLADMQAKGVSTSEHQLDRQLEKFIEEARHDVMEL